MCSVCVINCQIRAIDKFLNLMPKRIKPPPPTTMPEDYDNKICS